MNAGNVKSPLLIVSAVALILFGCRKDLREEQARLRHLDSLHEAAKVDSARQWSFYTNLDSKLELLDELPLEEICNDCIRILVVFGWSDPTVGPMMSIVISRDDATYKLRLRGFPDNKRTDMVERDLQLTEFNRLSRVLDSVRFSSLPLFEDVENRVFDGDVYYIEQVREGQYHGVTRSSRVDDFVYQLVADASLMAGLPKEFLAHFQRPSPG